MLAKIESHKAGYEEAILLDDHGHVCEGTGENIFVVRDGVISHAAADRLDPRRHQPPRGDPDRAATSASRSSSATSTRAELYLADEIFMTGTAAELTPIREVDDHPVGTGEPGEVTRAVQTAFEDALHGRTERYREWLDPVPVPATAA